MALFCHGSKDITEKESGGGGLGYLRALWHYWNHTACQGLPDDDEYLRRVCCCDADAWTQVKAIIFDNRYHFRQEDGLWHQPRCQHEYTKSLEIFEKRSIQASLAANKRWSRNA